MAETNQTTAGATVAQLKQSIDAGQTRQKVDNPDPGLSPLGTDDEAAGTPADPAAVSETLRRERAIGRHADAESASTRRERGSFIPWLLTGLLVLVVMGGIYLLRSPAPAESRSC